MKNLIDHFDASKDEITALVGNALSKADDGELFAEHRQTESLMFDNGKLKTASYNEDRTRCGRCSPAIRESTLPRPPGPM
jgi:TldD protein